MATFDHNDRDSWYFGSMTRQEATELLMNEKEGGTFLVRDSNSIIGDYVLCVQEDSKVSHYIINKMNLNDGTRYRIGDQTFPDLPALLAFYKLHYLDTMPLIRPASQKRDKVVAKFDFKGVDPDDLPFKKGEILTVISKDEEQWWTAENMSGQRGSIPLPYVEKYEESSCASSGENLTKTSNGTTTTNDQRVEPHVKRNQMHRKLPAIAKVRQVRIPNAYDKTALKLELGDIIKVTKMNINGQWEGELNGKHGHFPFTHVEFVDDGVTQNDS